MVLLSLVFCLSIEAWGVSIKAAHPATLHYSDGKTQELKANQESQIENKGAFLIKSTGRVPVLVAPTPSSDETFYIDAPTVAEWPPKQVAEKISSDLNFLMAEFESIRLLLKERQADKALDVVRGIKRKFPQLSYVNFLEASALVLKGDRDLARKRLKSGLKDFPNHENAKQLLRALGVRIE